VSRVRELLRPSFWYERAGLMAVNLLARALDLLLLVGRPCLAYAYLRLWTAEWVRNPYRWPRSFEAVRIARSAAQSPREFLYGETPLVSALWIFWRAGVGRRSHLYDLGAGRGRALLAARWLGARATGVELLPEHVALVREPLARVGVELFEGDAASVSLRPATHVYLPWTGLEPATRARWEARLDTLPVGTRIIAIDYPVALARAHTLARLEPWFSWGRAPVWLQELGEREGGGASI